MKTREIEKKIDLVNTLESGQTFRWRRESKLNEKPVYSTVLNGHGVKIKQLNDQTATYETTGIDHNYLRRHLGIDVDTEAIIDSFPYDEHLIEAIDRYRWMRLTQEEFFPCTVSFILSAQNNIPRIQGIIQRICKRYGEQVPGYGYTFPGVDVISELEEKDLRQIGAGYRAPYIIESAQMIKRGEVDPTEIKRMEYHDAHEAIKELMGVGDKVGDCILLFSLGFNEAVPVDRWIWRAIENYYPDIHVDDYQETCDGFRKQFGKNSGYAQNYLFHHIRKDKKDTE